MTGDAELMKARKAQRKLTQPLGNTVFMILTGLVVVLAIGLVSTALTSHASVFGLGHNPVCADVPSNGLVTSGSTVLVHARAATYSSANLVSVCANRPTAAQRTLITLTGAPVYLLYAAILLLLWQLLRTVRRTGPFTAAIARQVRFLGWFILGGYVAVTAAQSVARGYFASTIVTDQVPIAANAISSIFPAVLIACGLLTLARVMRLGAQMNDDLAGTV
jgi:Protein of unknown function (DUF2975)